MRNIRNVSSYYKRPQLASRILSNFVHTIDGEGSANLSIAEAFNDEAALDRIVGTGRGETSLVLGDFYTIQNLLIEAAAQIAEQGTRVLLHLEYGGEEFFPFALVDRRLRIPPHVFSDGNPSQSQIEDIKRCFEEFSELDLRIRARKGRDFCCPEGMRAWEVEVLRFLDNDREGGLCCLVGAISDFDYSEESDDVFEREDSRLDEAIRHMVGFAQETGIRLIVGGYCEDIENREKLKTRFGPDLIHKGASEIIMLKS